MKDNFSAQADIYARYRPGYPAELFDFILAHVKEKQTAWDCGTGSGQTARQLARHFNKVFATDISQKQLDNAYQSSNIFYSVQPAEDTIFSAHMFNLITVSQALHWFNFNKFYEEVKRVAKPDAYIAAWTYSLLTISPEIDELINKEYYEHTLGKYWDEERKHVEEKYSSIPFPFSEINTPVFKIEYQWTMQELAGYLQTWSALQKYIAVNGHNPLEELMNKINRHWKGDKMKVVFPLHLRMGKIDQ
jgi:ubiquinone/menaquinone biosynthesis C-methylase UbiE